ncbi:MAG: hypothetical protein D6795_14425 [Deltaproteobacteria bacterium]|nr:MAG: hypothetical protein D6795_14425 [Deltaproteobacteria bacterium]
MVAPQGSTSSLVLFNFVPLDVFVNRNHVATVPPFSIVGESGIFGMPRSAELRIPRDEILGDLPSIATLNTQQLKDFMPRLYEIFRIEIFIAFLEKLHKSNARKWQILEALQEREDLQSRKPSKGPRRVGTDPLDTLWHSPLFSGVVSREILDRLWKIVQKIARVETFRKGEEILPAHAVPDRIFAVHKGAVRLVGPAGEHLDEIVAGEISGEEFIAGTPSQTAWVSDSDDLVICSIYKRDLLDSPVKTLFFRNCFRILQEKIKANDRFIIQNEKRLYGLSPERTPSRPTDPSPSKTSTTPSSQPREADRSAPPQPAPIPSPPVGTQFRDARLARSEGTESAFPTFRRFRDAISESLSHWLGRSVEEKQDRELHEILDQLEGKES